MASKAAHLTADHLANSMQTYLVQVWIAVVVCGLAQAVLLCIQTWEHRRFARGRLRKPCGQGSVGHVALFAPCKGLDFELEDNLRPLLEQDYPDYELTFIAESSDDPACRPIRRLLAQHSRTPARLIVAGRAAHTGQKVHNLLVATAEISPATRFLAFIDSDARPGQDWLRRLVHRLERSSAGAATGYRWFVPARSTPANWLLYAINSAVAALFAPGGHRLVWGGSWAVRREVLDSSGLRERWLGTLSDDLVAAQTLREAKVSVEFEPACMLSSPVDMDFRQMCAFLRRQYLLCRHYVPAWWALGFVGATLATVGFFSALAAAIYGAVTGAEWTHLAAGACGAWYAMSIYRALLRRDLAKLYVSKPTPALASAKRFDLFAGPMVGLANWLVMASSLLGARVTWRGVTYELERDGRIRRMSRAA